MLPSFLNNFPLKNCFYEFCAFDITGDEIGSGMGTGIIVEGHMFSDSTESSKVIPITPPADPAGPSHPVRSSGTNL